jgi:hypothetical protein
MTRIERFTIEILQRAKAAPDAVHILTYQLAAQHGIEEKFIREKLEQLHTDKVIRLSAWDGTHDKPFEEWPSADYFFDYSADGNHKRIRLLLRGFEYLEKLSTPEPVSGSKPPIGFTP